MALRGDQRALLQLLSERGQSYDDISGLLGVSAEQVQEQAHEALTEIGGADPDAEVGLTDYLLGQADPIGRADAIRFLQTDPGSLELATRIEDGLREIAPDAKLPKLPEPRSRRARAAAPAPGEQPEPPLTRPKAPPTEPGRERPRADPRQNRLIAALGAVGVILLFVILAIAGVFSGGDSSASSTTPSDTVATTPDGSTTDQAERNITTVTLSPTSGSGVGGTAKFGLVNGSQLYIDLDLSGLPPKPAKNTTNLAWLMVGPMAGYPINNPVDSPITPDQNGNYTGRIAVPTPVAQTIGGNATAVKVSNSPIKEIADAAKQAAKEQAPVLGFIGTELASGDIPLVRDSGSSGGTGTSPGG